MHLILVILIALLGYGILYFVANKNLEDHPFWGVIALIVSLVLVFLSLG